MTTKARAVTGSFDEIFDYNDELIEANKIARDKDGVLLYEIYESNGLFTMVYMPEIKKTKKTTTVTEQNKRALELGMGVSHRNGVNTLECDRTGAVIFESKSIVAIQRKITQIEKQRLYDRVNKILNLHTI